MPRSPVDPMTAERAVIDRFSETVAPPFRRSQNRSLPEAGAAIDFDRGEPFSTTALGPAGESVVLYNLGSASSSPIPLYVLFHAGDTAPVKGQLNIAPFIPGDPDYTDLWRITRVTVPADYVANTATSVADLVSRGYAFERTTMLVNCPVVPEGSTAKRRFGAMEDPGLHRGWYRGRLIHYFTFAESALGSDDTDTLPVSPMYVAYNVNPDAGGAGSGPASGFKVGGDGRTHDVVAALPGDAGYSPVRRLLPYDNGDFAAVTDLSTALKARALTPRADTMNLPVVGMQ